MHSWLLIYLFNFECVNQGYTSLDCIIWYHVFDLAWLTPKPWKDHLSLPQISILVEAYLEEGLTNFSNIF